jgi:hypothetical protein
MCVCVCVCVRNSISEPAERFSRSCLYMDLSIWQTSQSVLYTFPQWVVTTWRMSEIVKRQRHWFHFIRSDIVESRCHPSGRAVWAVGLRPLECCYCEFESSRENGCLALGTVVCCHVEVSGTDRSLVQRSPTECVCPTNCGRGTS